MKELLFEQLQDYINQFKDNQAECIELMMEKKEWMQNARRGAGLKLLIEATLIEIKKYS
jgi:hypothetical protein